MKRTFGAAIGAIIFVLFMSIIATRLTPQVQAATPATADVTVNP